HRRRSRRPSRPTTSAARPGAGVARPGSGRIGPGGSALHGLVGVVAAAGEAPALDLVDDLDALVLVLPLARRHVNPAHGREVVRRRAARVTHVGPARTLPVPLAWAFDRRQPPWRWTEKEGSAACARTPCPPSAP